MTSKHFLKLNNLLIFPLLISASVFADTSKNGEINLPQNKIISLKKSEFPPLQGKIVAGRYHAAQNVFSCQACDFGEGAYTAQDVLYKELACVAFYNNKCDHKKAEIIFAPGQEKYSEKALKAIFEDIGIGILKKVDNAQGIEVLKEEMVEDNMFYTAISVEKNSYLTDPNGKHMAATRGYLIFQDIDKIVVLSNQIVTLPGQKHTPKQHIENLKQDILEFRKTFEFGLNPAPANETKKATAV